MATSRNKLSHSDKAMAVGSAPRTASRNESMVKHAPVPSLSINHDLLDVKRFTEQHFRDLKDISNRLHAMRANLYGEYPTSGQKASDSPVVDGTIPHIKDNLNASAEMVTDIFTSLDFLENQFGMIVKADTYSDD